MMTIEEQIKHLVQKARTSATQAKVIFGRIAATDAQKIQALLDIDTSGYVYVLDGDAVRHIVKEHGNQGKLSITDQDFELLPLIVNFHDKIEKAKYQGKASGRVEYIKIVQRKLHCIIEVRKKSKTMQVITFYRS